MRLGPALLRAVATLVTSGLLACGSSDQAEPTRAASYQLVSIGGRPLPYVSDSSPDRHCGSGLRASSYQLLETQWKSVDTLFEHCPARAVPESTWTRLDSGVFSRRGDTIQFENPMPGPGESRVLLLGLLRNDTLTAWGSDEDGGDHVYIRPRSP